MFKTIVIFLWQSVDNLKLNDKQAMGNELFCARNAFEPFQGSWPKKANVSQVRTNVVRYLRPKHKPKEDRFSSATSTYDPNPNLAAFYEEIPSQTYYQTTPTYSYEQPTMSSVYVGPPPYAPVAGVSGVNDCYDSYCDTDYAAASYEPDGTDITNVECADHIEENMVTSGNTLDDSVRSQNREIPPEVEVRYDEDDGVNEKMPNQEVDDSAAVDEAKVINIDKTANEETDLSFYDENEVGGLVPIVTCVDFDEDDDVVSTGGKNDKKLTDVLNSTKAISGLDGETDGCKADEKSIVMEESLGIKDAQGCSCKIGPTNEHKSNCSRRTVQCPDQRCPDTVFANELLSHIHIEHPHAQWLGELEPDRYYKQCWNIKSADNFKSDSITWVLTLWCFDSNVFVTMFQKYQGRWYDWIYVLGDEETAAKYSYKIRLMGSDTCLRYTGKVHSINKNKVDIREAQDCLVMTDEKVLELMTNDGVSTLRRSQGYDFRLPVNYCISKLRA